MFLDVLFGVCVQDRFNNHEK